MGCNMTSLILQESIYFAKGNNSKLYTCFLDAQKAFDKVWHDGLFIKLHELGLELYLWKLVVTLHSDLYSYVLFRGFVSPQFQIHKGTRQGGVLSPYLFLCYIDELLDILCASNLGLTVNGINLTCPSVADDMLLQSLTKNGLQILINICVAYFKKWRLVYNVLKCLVIVFNELASSFSRSQRHWFLGNEELREGDEYKHLGISVNKDMKVKRNVTESASNIRKIFFGLVSSGFSEMHLHPLTLKRIYESIVLPKSLYGCELWCHLSQSDCLLLERSHRLCIKSMQNMDRNTRTCVALSLFGTSSLKYVIHKRKLILFGQLCRLDTFYSAKRFFIYRMTSQFLFQDISCGFISDIFELLRVYDLEYVLNDYMNTGKFVSKYSWKRLINSKLKSCSDGDIMSEALNEGLGPFLLLHPEVKPSLFWELGRKYPYMTNACKAVVRLISLWFNRHTERICLACGESTENYVVHCLLRCDSNSAHRQKMWAGIWDKFGVDVYVSLAGLDNITLLSVFLGNFNVIADLLVADLKEQFYCFIARFAFIMKTICDSTI